MDTIVYAGRIKDREALNNSSSGGAFTALTDPFIRAGNAVLCAAYSYEHHQTEFRLIHSIEERDKSRGSMYMQSYTGGSWKDAFAWLKQNPEKKLMYVGLGCQAAGFIRFAELQGIRDRIVVIDIICNGTPSPMIWKEYACSLEKKGKMSHLNFRDKRKGWNNSVAITQINGKEVSLKKYRKIYSDRYSLRRSCSNCPYTTTDRYTDITIGDFWHLEKSLPDFFDDLGTSLFLIHTNIGKQLFEDIKPSLEYRQSNLVDCWQINLERPTKDSKKRNVFWHDYYKYGIDYVMNKYGTVPILRRIKRRIRCACRIKIR